MTLGYRIGDDLRGAGVVLKLEERIVGAIAVTPKAKTIGTNQRCDTGFIQQVGIGAFLLQIKKNRCTDAGDTVDADG